MWCRKTNSSGFTIVELTVVIVLVGLITTGMYSFFNTSFSQYLGLQQESTTYGELARQSQRVSSVVRTSTDIITANQNDFEAYAYFWPNDSYVSKIKYYLTEGNTKLVADVTPMSANPPQGTPLEASKRTYTIIENYAYSPGSSIFVYLDSAGAPLTMPITDLYTIKGIQTNLAVPNRTVTPSSANNAISVTVTLRNRKSNL